ncbi:mitochondrial fission ELM1 family protein [Aestuariivirga sp.]|uniref:mitochondrial fission ELM1 family protein n=1 Tax=Aestuariivirga sp. TaxID=2650926 RepID=UPI003BA8D52C
MPRVWILQSPHSGDNTQLRAISAALGWPFEVKRLSYRRSEGLLRLFSLATLAGVDRAGSSALAAPWPDLVIASGRGAEAVCFWLKRQNPKLRIVFVGTPWSALAKFDLVITTPQYRLPQAPNVLHNLLPLHDVTPQRIADEAARWEERLRHLPRPFTAVLVGGSSGPYLFTPEAARRLGQAASALASADGGSLLITTSARTGLVQADALAASLTVPHVMHRWGEAGQDNPFHAFLGLARQIVVTADSISMMAEAASTGKPVLLFDIEDGRFAMRAEGEGQAPIGWRGRSADATLFRALINVAPPRFSRDLRVVHRQLIAAGLAQWLGEAPAAPAGLPPGDELSRSAARIRGLFGL